MASLEVSFYVGKRLSINIFYILTFHLKTCQWMKRNAMPFFCLRGSYSIGQTRKQSKMWLDFFSSFITDTRKIKKRNKNYIQTTN